jgi:hypothetical protein
MKLLISTLLSFLLLGFASLSIADVSGVEMTEVMSSSVHMSQHAAQHGCCNQQSPRCSSVCTSLFATTLLPVDSRIRLADVPSFQTSVPATLTGHYMITVPPPR